MTTEKAGTLLEAAATFAKAVLDNPSARKLLRGWNCEIELHAKDTQESTALIINDVDVSVIGGKSSEPKVRVFGDLNVLLSILRGKENPTALYFEGLVDFEGPTPDEMRIDAAWECVYGGSFPAGVEAEERASVSAADAGQQG